MQTLERISPAPARPQSEPRAEKKSGPVPDDFNRLMQNALSARQRDQKDSPRAAALRTEKNHPRLEKNSVRVENRPTASTAEKITGQGDASAGDDEASADAAQKTVPVEKSPAADGVVLPLLDLTAPPLPVLPLIIHFGGTLTATETVPPAEKISGAAEVFSAEGIKTATATLPEKLQNEKVLEKSKTLAVELSPIKTGRMEGSQKADPDGAAVATEANAALKNAAAEISTAAATAAEKGGTGVATVELPMKKSLNVNKVAGLDGTFLPGDLKAAAHEKMIPLPAIAGQGRAAEGNSPDANMNPALPGTISSVDFSTSQSAALLPSLTDARLRNLERTHDMVAMHAVRLMQAQTDSLQVVIKPGAGTELSLELRQRDGGIEAHAVLARGDFQLMNQHWAELQQRLEQRGIKLAPLGGEMNFSSDSANDFKQQRESSQEAEAQKASAFAEFAVASRSLGATARLALGGWESWA